MHTSSLRTRLCAAVPLLLAAGLWTTPAVAQTTAPGEPEAQPAPFQALPNFEVRDKYNQPYQSKLWLTGTPILVDFWASWCGPCRFTLPEIQRIHTDYGDRLKVVGVSVDSGAGGGVRAQRFADDAGITYPIYYDIKTEARRATGVNIVPVLFLFDAEGKLVRDWWDEPDFDEVREAIDGVVEPAPPADPG